MAEEPGTISPNPYLSRQRRFPLEPDPEKEPGGIKKIRSVSESDLNESMLRLDDAEIEFSGGKITITSQGKKYELTMDNDDRLSLLHHAMEDGNSIFMNETGMETVTELFKQIDTYSSQGKIIDLNDLKFNAVIVEGPTSPEQNTTPIRGPEQAPKLVTHSPEPEPEPEPEPPQGGQTPPKDQTRVYEPSPEPEPELEPEPPQGDQPPPAAPKKPVKVFQPEPEPEPEPEPP